MRDGAQLIRKFLHKADTLFNGFHSTRRELSILGRQRSHVHAQCDQYLPGTVVQFARILSVEEIKEKHHFRLHLVKTKLFAYAI